MESKQWRDGSDQGGLYDMLGWANASAHARKHARMQARARAYGHTNTRARAHTTSIWVSIHSEPYIYKSIIYLARITASPQTEQKVPL